MTRVDLAGVSITIGDVAVVHGADLTASPGEVVGVLGPNGSGKSTLLKAVYRALRHWDHSTPFSSTPPASCSPLSS